MTATQELTYDPAKVDTVPIVAVRANSWNPKHHNPQGRDFTKVVKSVRQNGLRAPIVVREVPPDESGATYEVIDGEQRWRACDQLGFTHVVIYNEGQLDDPAAKALTIWYQQQVPFDTIMEAKLADSLAQLEVPLPYSDEELAQLHRLAWPSDDDYEDDELPGEPAKHTITLKLNRRQAEVIQSALDAARDEGSSSDGHTVVTWATEYLSDRGGVDL